MLKYHCINCSHTWTPRIDNPRWCPRCHNDWKVPLKRKQSGGQVKTQKPVSNVRHVRQPSTLKSIKIVKSPVRSVQQV